jgi:uncharacterized membrane protein (Fun14 family)
MKGLNELFSGLWALNYCSVIQPGRMRIEKRMSSEALLSNIIPFAGSGLVGYAIGFALKKILKWTLIIVGFLAGMFFVGVQLLQKYGYVSSVNWD